MSVIHFGAAELANIGNAILSSYRGGKDRERALPRVAKALATIAHANAACYRYRYGEPVDAVSQDQISVSQDQISGLMHEISGGRPFDLVQAISTAGLLGYNCIEDRDFLDETPDAYAALAFVCEKLMRLAAEKAGLVR